MVKSYEQEKTIPKLKEGAKNYREMVNSERFDFKFQDESKRILKEALKEKFPDGLCKHCRYSNDGESCLWNKAKPPYHIKKKIENREIEGGKVVFCEVNPLCKKKF